MSRRHLQFLLSGPSAVQLETLRRRWDPVMAARTPAHLTLAYPEEFDDEALLLARTTEAAAETPCFTIAIREIGCASEGDGGVWFLMDDASGLWSSLRSRILSAPFSMFDAQPHSTIVHPRTSTQGRSAFASLSGTSFEASFHLDAVVYTDTSESGMRVLQRFPLRASLTRVVGGILRRNGEVLLCFRARDRKNYPAVWDIPGGHVEDRETLSSALIRELEEELGIRARPDSAEPWTVCRTGAIELSIFVIDHWSGEPRNCAPEEHDEIRWVPIALVAELPLAHPSFQELLARAFRDLPPQE